MFYLYACVNLQQTRLNIYSVEPTIYCQNMYVKIDEDGYFMVKKNIALDDYIFEKVNCVYNELLEEKYIPFLLRLTTNSF